VLLKIELGKKLDSVAVSPDGSLLAAAVNDHNRTEQRPLDGEIKVFDASGRTVHELKPGGGPVFSLNFTADGKGLVYKTYLWDTGAKAYNLGRLMLRDLESGSEYVLLEEKPGYGSGLFSYSRSGIAAVPVGSEEVLEIRQVPEGRLLATLNREAYKEEFRYTVSSEGAFSADGSLFAAPFTSGGVVYARLFGADGWKLLKTFRLGKAANGGIAALAFSPDGKMLAAAQGNAFGSRVYIFNPEEAGR
jgi:WD40 repeat protein